MRILLLSFCLVGCGGGDYFTSERGVFVLPQGHTAFSKEAIDKMESFLVEKMPQAAECLPLMSARIFDLEEIVDTFPGQRVAGFQMESIIFVGDVDGCPWTSAYLHEAIHWVQYCSQQISDPNHKAEVWRILEDRPTCETP